MRLHYGTDWTLEEEADAILAKARIGITKHSMKKDYLSPGQLVRRQQREIYVNNGVPDKGLYSGMAKRAYAPGRHAAPRDLAGDYNQ